MQPATLTLSEVLAAIVSAFSARGLVVEAPEAPADDPLPIDEVATRLHYSSRRLRDAVNSGSLPAVKHKRHVCVRLSDARLYIETSRKPIVPNVRKRKQPKDTSVSWIEANGLVRGVQ